MGLIGDKPAPSTDESLAGIAEAVIIITALVGYFLMLSIESILELQRGRQLKRIDYQRSLAAAKAACRSSLKLAASVQTPSQQDYIKVEFRSVEDVSSDASEKASIGAASVASDWGVEDPASEISWDSYSEEPVARAFHPKSEELPVRWCYLPPSISSPRMAVPLTPEEEKLPDELLQLPRSLWSDDESLSDSARQRRRLSRLQILRGFKHGDACAAHNVFPTAKPRVYHPLLKTYHTLPESEATWVWASSLHKDIPSANFATS
eukprot:Gregarina_sp_Pseudo_9__3514@NODE_367_length_3026_cov_49_364915_g346_i0_p2_GENE_NODE_367_length_3026_cov_49_364915_g346_i0NODE_367_length_3026_cov_49_364915_g346_i0_p2_ORF_typecomplete_len264_score21_21DUF4501/PF14946_6/0_0056DUF5527/PF17665_1/0_18DUF5527/PF17665_1/6_9e02LapA_dom/PF06305_11/0_94LapA_dom/PF06305_11/1_5e03_NODE_367_length_3026_cov_49_364915_g346_i055846